MQVQRLECLAKMRRINQWCTRGKDDEVGYFYIILEGYEICERDEYDSQDFCEVRLVSSSEKMSAQFTNMNDGHMRGVFHFDREIVHQYHENLLLYLVGTFAF